MEGKKIIVVFSEQQGFSRIIINGLFVLVVLLFLALAWQSQTQGLLVGAALVAVLWALMLAAKMTTQVVDDGVTIRTLFFINRHISYDEIVTAQSVVYKPLRDFGGWGYRIGPGGKAYNMSGNLGVQLVLTRERRVLIGSQKPDDLAAAINGAMGH